MKSEKIIELIRHPEKIEREDLRELEYLLRRYPYFQAVRILYLKALNMQGGARFRSELRYSTVHLTSHKQFFRYLNQQIVFSSTPVQSVYSNLSNKIDERICEIDGHIEVNSLGIPAYHTDVPDEQIFEEEIFSFNIPQVSISNNIPKQDKKLSPPTPTNINVVSNPIILDNIPGMIDSYEEDENTTSESKDKTVYSNEIFFVDEVLPTEEIPHITNIQIVDTTTSVSNIVMTLDMDDVCFTSTKDVVEKTEQTFDTLEISSGAYRLPDTIKESPVILHPDNIYKQKKNELIEQFISTSPGMPKIKKTVNDNRDLSKENPYTQDDLFSETLAKIYVQQHLYDKAITTYINLSLKYPEKSVYFANRIDKINDNINQE